MSAIQIFFMSEKQNYTELFDKYIQGKLTPAERAEFFQLFKQENINPELEQFLLESYEQNKQINIWPEEFRQLFAARLAEKIIASSPATPARIRKMHTFRKWGWVAASVVLVIVGVYFWNAYKPSKKQPIVSNGHMKNDVAPGGQRATLTLADGSMYTLDSVANGQFAEQGNTQVLKLANGQIAYNLKGAAGKELVWNTMTTPNSGQYQLILPDGTKVWLNASSSITFPTAFTGNKREVKISGELYFEVAANKNKPFIIDVNGRSSVEVLGTSFNINSYTNEETIKTTLIEGSVKVNRKTTTLVASKAPHSAILKAGEQAIIKNSENIAVSSNVDVNKIIAWKNGIFDFTGSDLKTVMRQLERWYDIKVAYKGTTSNMIFEGRMYMNVNLSDVLEVLQKMGVKFELEGKTLTIF